MAWSLSHILCVCHNWLFAHKISKHVLFQKIQSSNIFEYLNTRKQSTAINRQFHNLQGFRPQLIRSVINEAIIACPPLPGSNLPWHLHGGPHRVGRVNCSGRRYSNALCDRVCVRASISYGAGRHLFTIFYALKEILIT